MDAAKRNDVETMKTLSKGLNANAKNVVSLKIKYLYLITRHCAISHKKTVLAKLVLNG